MLVVAKGLPIDCGSSRNHGANVIFKVISYHLFFLLMSHRNPPIRMQTMYVILSPSCIGSTVEKFSVSITTSDVRNDQANKVMVGMGTKHDELPWASVVNACLWLCGTNK